MRHSRWSEHEFGQAEIGDERRVRRLIRVGAAMAATPAGRVTEIFSTSAEREGAYRFLENDDIQASAIAAAQHRAAANRCFGQEFVFVPVDGSSLNLPDRRQRRGMGILSTNGKGAQGMHVMSAIAVRRDGTPLGVCGQRYWTRKKLVGLKRGDYDKRSFKQRESRYWIDVMTQVQTAFSDEAPGTRPWFQLDRGGDIGRVLSGESTKGAFFTVRSTHDRRLAPTVHGHEYLWNYLRRKEPQGSYAIQIPEGKNRSARVAHVHIRFCPVALDLQDRVHGQHRTARLWAVRVGEIDTTPRGETRLDWLLLTTYPVETIRDALLVVEGYTSRWRIEEFHKTWKSGACCVEHTQLQNRDHIERFAIISASVAMRIQRLTHLARTTPDEPATVEFSRAEIDAAILMRKPKGVVRGATPTIAEAVRWIADLGGFMGPSPANKTATRRTRRYRHRTRPAKDRISRHASC
jgi:hypothetical protein